MRKNAEMRCACGAKAPAEGHWENQGDGIMTALEFFVVDIGDWEGGDPKCTHNDAEVVPEVASDS